MATHLGPEAALVYGAIHLWECCNERIFRPHDPRHRMPHVTVEVFKEGFDKLAVELFWWK